MDLLQSQRYKDKPVYLFFEKYVQSVIGQLSAEKSDLLNNMDLQQVFSAQSHEWKDVVREVLQLSSTIDIAILQLWYQRIEAQNDSETTPDPDQFSKEFVDRYFEENSTVDQWTEDSLNAAKEFILQNKNLEKV